MKTMKALPVTTGICAFRFVFAALIAAFVLPETALAKKAYADSQGRLGLAGPAIANPPKGAYTGRSRAQAGATVNEKPLVAGVKFPGLNDTQLADAQEGDALAIANWRIRVNNTPTGIVTRTGVGALATNTDVYAVGSAAILDPWDFDNVAGESLSLAFGFDSAGLGAEGEGSFGNLSGFAGTNLPGLETLFQYSITAVPSEPALIIQFWSNPLLGLDDASIVSLLKSNIAPDPINGGFGGTLNDFDFLSLTLNIPVDQSNLSLDWNVGATAIVVPEASTLFAGAAAVILILGKFIRAKRKSHVTEVG